MILEHEVSLQQECRGNIMDNLSALQPFAGQHSIREAVITAFLVSKIVKPEKFKELLTTELKNDFIQFEPTNQIQFKFDNNQATLNQIPNIGFTFTNYNEGNRAEVLRGINEENRQYFSFHSLDYKNWEDFQKKFIKYVNILNEFQPNFIQAFSLHYIDEFNWENIETFKTSNIFQKPSDHLPNDFYDSKNCDLDINLQKTDHTQEYFDRLTINIADKLNKKNIIISHNSSISLSDTIKLGEYINSTSFQELLQRAHERNKQLLKDILTNGVCNRINL